MYYKNIDGDYISSIGQGRGGTEIAEAEYNNIMSIIKTEREEPPTDYVWRLRNDSLTYELVYFHREEPEEVATEQDYQDSLTELGVDMSEE